MDVTHLKSIESSGGLTGDMESAELPSSGEKRIIILDPRTKLFLWILANAALLIFRHTHFPAMIMLLYAALFLLAKQYTLLVKTSAGFLILFSLVHWILPVLPSMVSFLMAMVFVMYILYPVGVGFTYMVSTTSVGELTDALRRMHVSDTVSMMSAVVIRFLPMIRQEFSNIRSAMKLREIRGFTKRITCIYVPMLVSVAETAEELGDSITARGIENPAPKTSWHQAGFHLEDALTITAGILMLAESVWELAA